MEYQEVGQALLRHYFSKEIGGDTLVCSVDVSDCELAEALSCSPEEVNDILLCSCKAYTKKRGYDNPYLFYSNQCEDTVVPECVTFLIFACRIAQKAGEKESKNFSECLKEAFGYMGGYPPYRLNDMWDAVVTWCRGHQEYRDIQLPPEVPARKHIGVTQDITFPTWRDESTLKDLLPEKKRTSLDEAELALHQVLLSSKETPAFTKYFDHYRELLKQGSQERYDCLFGQFLFKFLGTQHPNLQEEDTSTCDLILRVFNYGKEYELSYGGQSWEEIGQGLEKLKPVLPCHGGLSGQLKKRVFIFEKTGFGEYTATLSPEVDTLIVAYHKDHAGIFSTYGQQNLGENWFLTDEMDPGDEDTRECLQNFLVQPFRYFHLEKGIRYRSTFLRHESVLPVLKTLQDGKIRIGNSTLRSCSAGKDYDLGVINKTGVFPVLYYGKSGARDVSRKQIFTVYDFAPLTQLSSLSDSWQTHAEFHTDTSRAIPFAPSDALREECHRSMETLQEALYFKGQSGWQTKPLLDLIATVTSADDAPSKWDILRSLVEGGWLVPYWARRFGVTRYQVVRPHFINTGESVLLWGARPHCIVDLFTTRVEALGGKVSQWNGIGSFSPATWQAHGVTLAELKSLCTEQQVWGETRELCRSFLGCGQKQFWSPDAEQECTQQHKPARYWDWKKDCFSLCDTHPNTGIHLLKEPNPEGGISRYHTLYKVLDSRGQSLTTPVRNIALLHAFRLKGKALFHMQDGLLFRIGSEGYLPVPIGATIAQSLACCSGPVHKGDSWCYTYALNTDIASFLTAALGESLFSGELLLHDINAPYHYPSPILYRHRPELRNIYKG